MEKKKVAKKATKKVENKPTTKKVSKTNTKKKKEFTLIELLAVIIILGILMIIAIPSVTKYINDSRRSAYVDTAKEVIGAARNLVNSGKEEMYDTDATYYLDVKCIGTENAMKSPYGEFVDLGAFVVVTYNGKGYDYFWTSVDDAGQGIKNIIKDDKLDIDNIESDLSIDDITTNRTIDGREKVILITDRNGCKKEGAIEENLIQISSSTGKKSVIIYPRGKTKETVSVGDIVKIGTEDFNVVKHNGSDLVLIANYNLNVGSNKKNNEPAGIQSSSVIGYQQGVTTYGAVKFAETNYWNGKVGNTYPGVYCRNSSETNCAYIYDSNSNLYQYVNEYKSYLEEQGAPIKEARLMSVEEAVAFRNDDPSSWARTSYFLGTANDSSFVYVVSAGGGFSTVSYSFDYRYGVRPIIIF